jgi:hypothetical protein
MSQKQRSLAAPQQVQLCLKDVPQAFPQTKSLPNCTPSTDETRFLHPEAKEELSVPGDFWCAAFRIQLSIWTSRITFGLSPSHTTSAAHGTGRTACKASRHQISFAIAEYVYQV